MVTETVHTVKINDAAY